jgi:hypothetical protein
MKPQIDFVLEHLRQDPNGSDDFKMIGVWSTALAAQRAIRALRLAPGFRDCPDGVHVGRCELDKTFWAEGFGANGV